MPTITREFDIVGSTGVRDADSLPTAVLVINGNDSGASVTVTHKATGRYQASVSAPSLNDYDHVQVIRFSVVEGLTNARPIVDFVQQPETAAAPTLAGEFCINGSGGTQDADTSPTCVLVVNGVDSGASVTVSHKAAGRYKWIATAPTIADYDQVQIVRTATVDALVDTAPVFEFNQQTVASGGGSPAPPSSATPTSGRHFRTRDLAQIGAGTAPPEVFNVVDASGDPVDVSAKDLRFVVANVSDLTPDDDPFDDVVTGSWSYETGGSGITVGGTGNNVVTVQHDASKTVTPGEYRYFLIDVTDSLLLATGRLPIIPTALRV